MEARDIVVHPDSCVRCYRCQLECSFLRTRMFNPEEAFIKIDWNWVNDKPSISFTDDCDNCGVCVRACIYECLTLREKG
ncbi:4Fe-4S dicluster domain-containing protein [Chloroflexota bacterium]